MLISQISRSFHTHICVTVAIIRVSISKICVSFTNIRVFVKNIRDTSRNFLLLSRKFVFLIVIHKELEAMVYGTFAQISRVTKFCLPSYGVLKGSKAPKLVHR